MVNPSFPSAPTPSQPAGTAVDAPINAPFFPVTFFKFVTMSIVTLGLYDIYWCYHQWVRVRDRGERDISPFWRAFIAPLWGFSLFPKVSEYARACQEPVSWSPGLLATAFLVLSITWRLPDPWWLVSLLAFVPLMPVVATIEEINRRSGSTEDVNGSFSGENFVGGIIGSLVLLLAIIGTLFPA